MFTSRVSRRDFVAGAVAGLSLTRAVSPARVALGANERIVLGLIGAGGQGVAHLKELLLMEDIAVAAICDVDQSRLGAAVALTGGRARPFRDFRHVLDMKEVDGVLVATPGHWHGIPAIMACGAGKDVYVEKPVAHNIREGRALVEAARRHGRIVQVGTQQRSTPHWIEAVDRIRRGELGRINMVHVWNAWNSYEMFGDIGRAEDGDPPPGVDYDMWLGPAPKRPFNRLHFHGTHYFFWAYGGGMMSDWAIHLFDVVTWAMGPEILSVAAVGGRNVFDDARETPDTASAAFECPGYTMVYTMRHGNGWQPHGDMDHGIEFFGANKTLQINRRGFQIYEDKDRATRKPTVEVKGETGIRAHKRNFLEAMRTRKPPSADAQVGHLGSIPGHLANISYRVGRRIRWDGREETIPGDPEAAALLGREYRAPWHL